MIVRCDCAHRGKQKVCQLAKSHGTISRALSEAQDRSSASWESLSGIEKCNFIIYYLGYFFIAAWLSLSDSRLAELLSCTSLSARVLWVLANWQNLSFPMMAKSHCKIIYFSHKFADQQNPKFSQPFDSFKIIHFQNVQTKLRIWPRLCMKENLWFWPGQNIIYIHNFPDHFAMCMPLTKYLLKFKTMCNEFLSPSSK